MPERNVRGGIIIDGRRIDATIPAELVKVFDGRPRVVLGKLEWYGIHPIPIDLLAPELRGLAKEYEIVAVPKGMMP